MTIVYLSEKNNFTCYFKLMKSFLIFYLKKFFKTLIRIFDFQVIRFSPDELLITRNLEKSYSRLQLEGSVRAIKFITDRNFKEFLYKNLEFLPYGLEVCKSLYLFREKRYGFFVEFGASDGIEFSNTLVLEKLYNWSGILVEPNRSKHKLLSENREVIIDTRAVWTESGQMIDFLEVSVGGLSGLTTSLRSVNSHKKRKNLGAVTYKVETVSLNDLLYSYNCPPEFDFLSLDTEGSELKILKKLNFQFFRPKVICIEFYGNQEARLIIQFMVNLGYKRVIFSAYNEDNLWFTLK
jgi:FkbM family methyltransferase